MERSERSGSASTDDWLAAFQEADAVPAPESVGTRSAVASTPTDDWLTALHDDPPASPAAGIRQPDGQEPAPPHAVPPVSSRRTAGNDQDVSGFGTIFDDDRAASSHATHPAEPGGAILEPGSLATRRRLKLDLLLAIVCGIAIGVLGALAFSKLSARSQARNTGKSSRLATTSPVSSQDVVVSPGHDGQFTTIGDAIANAQAGSRIRVRPGVYRETLTLNKPVEIVGEGDAKEIVIDVSGHPCVVLHAETAAVANLTLRSRAGSAASEKSSAVDVPHGRLTLDGCDLTSETNACLSVHGSKSYALVRRCTIHDGGDAGVAFLDKAAGVMEDCEIFGNAAPGVLIAEESGPTIQKCNIHNGKKFGLLIEKDGRGTIVDCDIAANGVAGVCVKENGAPVFHGCTIRDGPGNGFWFIDNGRGAVVRCEVFGNALPDVSIGKESNATFQYCKIRDGKRCGVHIYAGGRGTLDGCQILSSAVAGVQIENESQAILRSCTIRGGEGNGLFLTDKSSAHVSFCEFSSHDHPEIWVAKGANPAIHRCKIHHGKAEGIVFTEGGHGTVTDTDIFENALSGVVVGDSEGAAFQESRINRNGDVAIRLRDGGAAHVNSCNLDDNKGGAWSLDAQSRATGEGNSVPFPTGGSPADHPRAKSASALSNTARNHAS